MYSIAINWKTLHTSHRDVPFLLQSNMVSHPRMDWIQKYNEYMKPVSLREGKKKWSFFITFAINPIRTGGGTLCPPCYVLAYNRANTRTSMLKKIDFSQL